MKDEQLNITMLGSGAIASFYAFNLSKFIDVEVVTLWSERLAFLKGNGVSVDGVFSKVSVQSKELSTKVKEVLIIANKTFQNNKNIEWLKNQDLSSMKVIFLLQNGYGEVERFRSEFADVPVYQIVTNQGAKLMENGDVLNTGNGNLLLPNNEFGVYLSNGLLEKNTELLNEHDLNQRIIEKLAVNVIINPLTAFLGCKNGALVDVFRGETNKLIEDVSSYFVDKGVFTNENEYKNMVFRVAVATSENTSSMLYDKKAGRNLELNSILKPVLDKLPGAVYLKELYEKLLKE